MDYTRYLAAVMVAGCTGAPAWYGAPPRLEREGAYEWFVIAQAEVAGARRTEACSAALDAARAAGKEELVAAYADRSPVVSAAGGPSRVELVLRRFADHELQTVEPAALAYDDARRRCYVEIRWLLPKDVAAAVAQSLEPAAEASVDAEVKRALVPASAEEDRAPVVAAPGPSAKSSPEAAALATYPGWFVRVLPESCPGKRQIFVGVPGGPDARWLVVERARDGWLVHDDTAITADDWPAEPPRLSCAP